MSAESIDTRARALPHPGHGIHPWRSSPFDPFPRRAAGEAEHAPSEASTFREGGSFESPGVPGSGSVAVCARCGGDVPLAGPFRRTVVLDPPAYLYSHLSGCDPAAGPRPARLV